MTGVEAREIVEAAVRRELFGPAEDEPPRGSPIDCSGGEIEFESAEESRGQFHDAVTLQEILTQSSPLRRYGIGVLHSGGTQQGSPVNAGIAANEDVDISWVPGLSDSDEVLDAPSVEVRGTLHQDEADSDDFDLTDANSFKPSAMALSIKCRVPVRGSLEIKVRGAYYDRVPVRLPGFERPFDWWLRKPFELVGNVAGSTLLNETHQLKDVVTVPTGQQPRLSPTAQVFSRPVPGEQDQELRLVTVAVVNQAQGSGPSNALFQMRFTVAAQHGLRIEPYPETDQSNVDEEQQSIDLLYRNKRTYAIGHGCAASWENVRDESAPSVRAEPMPAYETVSLTPDVYVVDDNGVRTAIKVSMEALSEGNEEGQKQVELVLRSYESWIKQQETLIPDLLPRFQEAAARHIQLCREALERMHVGWRLVGSSPIAERAFRLANRAMLHQQVRSRLPLRRVERVGDDVLRAKGPHPEATVQPGQGNWRPFQIAFILASLPELVEPKRKSRSLVDLIFFPTGGGKTEAYLGASAISLLARRLRNPDDAGTDTLMRYTLRLLTAQQFLRAASLVCVLEDIRSNNHEEFGEAPFGIGIWLGGSSTPNNWKKAVEVHRRLGSNHQEQNLFLLLRCPWCGTQMGTKPRSGKGQDVLGYERVGNRILLRCVDQECRFSSRAGLPIHVVDEDIYDVRPSIVIGTVDKLAMMAWRPQARSLFGLSSDGQRDVSPPNLIIQDELHLISGPLGSMVGLYEPIIHDLCTDHRNADSVPPKIVASTATIRRYEDQVRGLFGRDKVALFPPHGLEEGSSFFAEPDTMPDGTRKPGQRYLGVMSASLGSTQTVQVRVASATLQAATEIPEPDRDGYWTNLNFLNSLRELGNTVSLLQSDVPDYLTGLRHRDEISPRWPRNVMELTSRRRSDEIPKAIEQLEIQYGSQGCVDICLASNIIEVGVDIDRLGLMTIIGQPKTTAQYIQVSGRIGRRADKSPGLVIIIYGAAKPRDRSHYERFFSYHQSLYAQVEPTSLTPFAVPVLKRALHAAAVSHIRQVEPEIGPHPFPQNEYDNAITLLRDRAMFVDPNEVQSLDQMARTRAREWNRWERTEWEANVVGGDPKQGLMRFAGTLPDLDSKATIWDVPTSMRNVDAECRVRISLDYSHEDAEFEEQEL